MNKEQLPYVIKVEQLNNYIENLSKNDKKDLVQKTLKLGEEFGELAKVVLPYKGAYGTNHRVINKDKILEEIVDIFLVNQSLIHELGYNLDDFYDKVFEKAQIWESLQKKEDRAISKSELMPYEIHITLKDVSDIKKFKEDCKSLGVKPIVLALQDSSFNKKMDDIMTSHKVYGNNGDAFEEMNRVSESLKKIGYKVIREKIEASYWHTKAPFRADKDKIMPKGCYFEVHLNIRCNNEIRDILANIAKDKKCHLSTNIFKKFDNQEYTIMMTYRAYEGTYEDFEEHLESIKKDLNLNNFNVEKEIVEFAIYDTKINHDDIWLN